MNGKKAKKLRKTARENSVGMPEVEYILTKKHLIELPNLPKPVQLLLWMKIAPEPCIKNLKGEFNA